MKTTSLFAVAQPVDIYYIQQGVPQEKDTKFLKLIKLISSG